MTDEEFQRHIDTLNAFAKEAINKPLVPAAGSVNDTPRTDAAEMHSGPTSCTAVEGLVEADFARQLERENNGLRNALMQIKDLNYRLGKEGSWKIAEAALSRNIYE